MSSLVMIRWPSNGMCGSIVASVPVAITMIACSDQSLAAAVDVVQLHGVRIVERSCCADQLHAVARQLMPDDIDLVADDLVGAEQQILDRDVLLDGVGHAVERRSRKPGQVQNGLAECLAGDGAGVDADAAEHGLALDDARRACRAWRPESRPAGPPDPIR